MAFQTVNPVIDLLSEQQPSVYYTDDGTAFFKCVGLPEGVIFANAGSFCTNASGQAFIKTTGITLNTGWSAIQSAVNVASDYIAGLITAVGNVGAGLDQLHVTTVSAGSLVTDGDFAEFYTRGFTAANANTKRYVFSIAGLGNILDTGLVAQNGLNWECYTRITRVSNTLVRGTSRYITNGAGFDPIVQRADIAVVNLATTDIFPQSQGEATANDDIVENVFQYILWRQ